MKKAKRIICILLVLVTLLGVAAMPISAKPVSPSASGSTGKVISVAFEFDHIIAISGTFTYSNPELFSSVDLSVDGLSGFFDEENGRADYFGVEAVDCVMTLKLTVAENARIGDQCEITFTYESTETGNLPSIPVYEYDRVTVTIVKGVDYSALKAAIARMDALSEKDYTASSWAEMMLAYVSARSALVSEDQSVVDAATQELNDAIDRLKKIAVDYSALKKQIRIAEDLDEADYTPASWEKLQSRLTSAREALNSTEQSAVDQATANLKAAIDALVRAAGRPDVDYTELKRQIAKAEALDEALYTRASWSDLAEALADARDALKSKAQSTVDSAANDLADAIAALVKINALNVDYTELNKQIAIAEGLKPGDYTAASREVMQTALERAKAARASDSQSEVNEAAAALKEAIAELVRMDFAALLEAIDAVRRFSGENGKLSELWMQMHDLLARATELMQNGDQAAVDQCAKDISELLAKITDEVKALEKNNIVEVEKPVPAEPTDDYCNIVSHSVWPVLFWISLAINLVGILLVVGFLLLRRKKMKDDTPLVDYDIEDDAE